MEQGGTRRGRNWDGIRTESARLPKGMLGLRVRVTVECAHHGSHSAVLVAPFLWAIDAVTTFRDICSERERWCVCEYEALDYVPDISISDWV